MKASEIIFDHGLYPRIQIDPMHITSIAHAITLGEPIPRPVVERATKRCVDGAHRIHAYMKLAGPDVDIDVEERDYASDAEFFEDSLRLNARHGRALNAYERADAVRRAEQMGITVERTAGALCLTLDAVKEMRLRREATGPDGDKLTVKGTLRHMAGKRLNKHQVEANAKAGGMQPAFYVNQVINLLEGDLIDWENEYLKDRLLTLAKLIAENTPLLKASQKKKASKAA